MPLLTNVPNPSPIAGCRRQSTTPLYLSPPLFVRVNRRACRFGRHQIPYRPHPLLSYSHQPSTTTVRWLKQRTYTSPFWAPGQRVQSGLQQQCRFGVAPHTTCFPPSPSSQNWMTSDSSALVMVQGSLIHRPMMQDFCVDVIDALHLARSTT
jgi:hypothetical protein